MKIFYCNSVSLGYVAQTLKTFFAVFFEWLKCIQRDLSLWCKGRLKCLVKKLFSYFFFLIGSSGNNQFSETGSRGSQVSWTNSSEFFWIARFNTHFSKSAFSFPSSIFTHFKVNIVHQMLPFFIFYIATFRNICIDIDLTHELFYFISFQFSMAMIPWDWII